MPSKKEEKTGCQQESSMEAEILLQINNLNKRVKEIIRTGNRNIEDRKNILIKAEHDKYIQETKSHAEDSERHLTMIKRLIKQLGKLLYEINNLMLERECSITRELLAECKRKYGEL